MAKCDICGKGVTFGIQVSHSHRRSNRTWKPNVRRVKALVEGTPRHINVCTRCLPFRQGNPRYLIFFVTLNMLKALCTSGCFFSAHYFCSMLR